MRWILIFLIMESCLWGGSLSSARADIIGFQFKGSWTQVDSDFTSFLTVKHSVTGTIHYDTSITAATDSNQNKAYYYGSDSKIIDLSFTTDNTPAQISKARIAVFAHSITQNNSISPASEFQLWFNTKDGPGKATPGSLPGNTNGSFLAYNFNHELFNNDLLPCAISPNQADLTMSFTLSLPAGSEAKAKINSITTLPVPEPETIILLCLGLTLIFFCRRPDNRKSRLQKLRA